MKAYLLMREDLDGVGEAGVEGELKGDVEEAQRLQVAGPVEPSGIDGAQTSGLDQSSDRGLGVGVIAGEKDVQGLAGDLPGDERGSERRVEGLDDPSAGGCLAGDLLGGGGVGGGCEAVEGLVQRVADVDHDLAVELVAILLHEGPGTGVGHGQHDDVARKPVACAAGLDVGPARAPAQLLSERLGVLAFRRQNLHVVAAGQHPGTDAAGHVAGSQDGHCHEFS
jgi:hypothetical protein